MTAMQPGGAGRDLWLSAIIGSLLLSAALLSSCAATGAVQVDALSACTLQCAKTGSCDTLDRQLVGARLPLLECVGQAAARGHLTAAHRCYRALRLLESARWWLQTLTGRSELQAVYQPAETIRQEFLCRIEQLAQAKTPEEVERIYLEMIRSYP